jgi:predicted nucleic acid-binding protein
MRQVFVDTGGFVGLLIAEDVSHGRARDLLGRANAERWQLVTTNAVVFETYSVLLMRSRDRRRGAMTFLDLVAADAYRIERVRPEDEERAVALVREQADKTYSLVDALSFMVMERLGIDEAIAFDRHFRDYGRFRIL